MRALKDSSIEWIGEIPSEWDIVKSKYIFTNHKEIVGDREKEFERLSLTLNGVLKRPKDDNKGLQSDSLSTYQILYQNELVFKMIDLENISTSRVGYSEYTGLVSPVYIIFNNDEYSRYGYWYFYNLWQRNIYNTLGNNNVRSALNASDMLGLPFIKMPLPEQQRIADFLDRKCAEIDTVIEKTKATIEEYKKLKQSIITEAVTKGIRGNRTMKNSGVEWIGEIANSYRVIKLKHLLKSPLLYGANESGIPFEEHLPRYIRITDITNDGKLKETGKLSLLQEVADGYVLQNDDILFARSGASVGKAFIYKDYYGCAAFAGYLIKASVGDKLLADYLFFYTQSSIYEEWKNQIFVQATIQNIGADRYNTLPIVLGSIDEQQEIVEYLDVKCAEIDSLITKKTELLTQLEEYKKSVIYEYVTGKKEVK